MLISYYYFILYYHYPILPQKVSVKTIIEINLLLIKLKFKVMKIITNLLIVGYHGKIYYYFIVLI
jgi:hypothetical protein